VGRGSQARESCGGSVLVEIGIEWFDAETDVLQDNITIGMTRSRASIDGLRDYSDAHGGTMIDVVDPDRIHRRRVRRPDVVGLSRHHRDRGAIDP
jgi:hypothetical protein